MNADYNLPTEDKKQMLVGVNVFFVQWEWDYKLKLLHTYTLTVWLLQCVFCCQCKTPWGGADLLKWRSSIAPLLLRFPNKPHFAPAACSSQITHNGESYGTTFVCLAQTDAGWSMDRHIADIASIINYLVFNFICLPSSISSTGLGAHKWDLSEVVNRRRHAQIAGESILEASETPALWRGAITVNHTAITSEDNQAGYT